MYIEIATRLNSPIKQAVLRGLYLRRINHYTSSMLHFLNATTFCEFSVFHFADFLYWFFKPKFWCVLCSVQPCEGIYRLEPVSSAPTVAVWTAPPPRTRSVLPQGTGARTVITAVSSFVTTCEPYNICVRIGVRSTGWGGSAPISWCRFVRECCFCRELEVYTTYTPGPRLETSFRRCHRPIHSLDIHGPDYG